MDYRIEGINRYFDTLDDVRHYAVDCRRYYQHPLSGYRVYADNDHVATISYAWETGRHCNCVECQNAARDCSQTHVAA